MITIYKKPPLFDGWWIFNDGTQIMDKQVAGIIGKTLHWWERLNWRKTCDATLQAMHVIADINGEIEKTK